MAKQDLRLIDQTRHKFKEFINVKLLYALVFSVFACASVFFIYHLKDFKTAYSIEQFVPKNDQLLDRDHKIKALFGLGEKPTFYVLAKNDKNWIEPSQITKLSQISEVIQQQKNIVSVYSVNEVQTAIDNSHELLVGSPFKNLAPEKWVSFVKENPFLIPNLINESLDEVLLIVEMKDADMADLQTMFGGLKNQLSEKYPEVNFNLAGALPTQSELSLVLSKEVKMFFALIILIFFFVSFLVFSDLKSVFFIVGSLALANLSMIGLLSFVGIPFNALLSTLPVMVSIAVISILVHTLHLWAQVPETTRGFNDTAILTSWRTMKDLFAPNLIGTMTTGLGFFTLSFNHIPIIKQYGLVIFLLLMAAWLYTQFLLFLVMPMIKTNLRPWTSAKAYWVLGLLNNRKHFLKAFAVGIPIFAFFAFSLNFSTQLYNELPERSEVRKANEWVDKEFSGLINLDIVLKADSEDFWKQSENNLKLKSVVSSIKELKDVRSVVALNNFFKEGRSPASTAELAETMFLYSMSEKNPLNMFLSQDGKSTRVAIRLRDVASSEVDDKINFIENKVKQEFPTVKYEKAGVAATILPINKSIAQDLVFGFWHSMLIIAFVLVFIFRSVRWAIVACIPNLVPPILLIGAMGMLGIPIKPSVALVFSIALGLAFNNTVYLLFKLKKVSKNVSNYLPVKKAFLLEGNPCLLATTIVFSGFTVFLFSDFELNKTFGLFMLLSIVGGLIGDLMFLPILLYKFPQLLKKSKNNLKPLQTAAAGVVGAFAIITLAATEVRAEVKLSAEQILKKSQALLQAKDDSAKVKMKIIEADGSVKNREIEIKSLNSKAGYFVMAKVLAPADIKGTGFLGSINKDSENQWIYLPSSKQVRRVVGGASSAGLLGSELSAADLNSAAIKGSKVKIAKDEDKVYVLEVTPQAGTSKYTKVHAYIAKNFLPEKTEYYEGDKLMKTISFFNYKKYKNVYRTEKIKVINHSNKRGTEIELSQIQVNQGLKASEFTPESLKD